MSCTVVLKGRWETVNEFAGFLSVCSAALHCTASIVHLYFCQESFVYTVLEISLLLFGNVCVEGGLKEGCSSKPAFSFGL